MHREAGVDERQRVGGGERVRDDGRVAAAAQQPQAAVHDLGGRGALGADGEVGDVGSPRQEPSRAQPPRQRRVSSVMSRGSVGGRPRANSRLGYRARVLFVATDPVFSQHDTGPRPPGAAGPAGGGRRGHRARRVWRTRWSRCRPGRPRPRSWSGCTRRPYLDALEARAAPAAGCSTPTPSCRRTRGAPRSPPPGPGSRRSTRCRRGAADAAFLALRPPGHHARPSQGMGFCLLNNVAVAAAELRGAGRAGADRRLRRAPRQRDPGDLLRRPRRALRVVPRVAAVPGHRAPRRDRPRRGRRHDVNVPLPAGATGDVYLRGARRGRRAPRRASSPRRGS